MTRDSYLKFAEEFFAQARALSAKKNSDYAGSGGQEAFANFTRVEYFGIATTEQGFLTRMVDKFCRIITFAKDGKLQVADEAVHDTLIDLANYSCLLAAYISEKGKPGWRPGVVE